jgi:hypothetical protein
VWRLVEVKMHLALEVHTKDGVMVSKVPSLLQAMT